MSLLELTNVSRWFGNVVAVNAVTMTIGPGVTGLLGPNGAGKSTLLHLMSGFLSPSSGTVTMDGQRVQGRPEVFRQIGLVPEREATFPVTGRQFVLANARLQGLTDAVAATARALETVDLIDAMDRPISTYSKGMRQRAKVAAALVHDPAVLLLDEPFNGLDPRQRVHLMEVLQQRAAAGCAIVVSSHILEEVESLAGTIEVMVAGRHAASGDFRKLRALMSARPHHFTVRSSNDRLLASALVSLASTTSVTITDTLQVQTRDVNEFAVALPAAAAELGLHVNEVSPADESLEVVFSYLVETR